MAAIPLPNADRVFQDSEVYTLFYGSRYLRLQSLSPDAPLSYWAPKGQGGEAWQGGKDSWIGAERWMADAVPWEKGTACWAKEVVGFLPSPSVAELGREDVEVLRKHRRGWVVAPQVKEGRRCVVIGDEVLTSGWVQCVQAILGAGWMVERVQAKRSQSQADQDLLFGASLCLLVGGPDTQAKWAPIWRLPKGAVLLEFQQELAVDGECQHVAHLSDLASWIFLLAKGSVVDNQEDVLTALKGWWGKHQGMFS
jgi:hypothetical protein